MLAGELRMDGVLEQVPYTLQASAARSVSVPDWWRDAMRLPGLLKPGAAPDCGS